MAVLAGSELCAGVGMLGEGARAAFEFLGHEYRTVCYVEREAPAASQLVTLMEAGIIDTAPIWTDLLTFDGAAWRGRVDCVIAGFPCQDLSIAGRRAGLDGERSGLFFDICDIADDCGAQFLLLENVSAIASATATVVDKAAAAEITGERYRPRGICVGESDGAVQERAAARVMGELADRGWDAEWITLSASDVGASHKRARWFCFAWRVADPERTEWRPHRIAASRSKQGHDRERQTHGRSGIAKQALGNTGLQHQQLQQRSIRPEHSGTSKPVDDPTSPRCNGARIGPAANVESRQCLSGAGRPNMAHAGRCDAWWIEHLAGPGGSATEYQPRRPEVGIFAPGPDSGRWPGILDQYPHLAPATEPGIRGVVDGLALVVDQSRTHQLRQIGNGVVPLCAAVAFVQLMRRAGIA